MRKRKAGSDDVDDNVETQEADYYDTTCYRWRPSDRSAPKLVNDTCTLVPFGCGKHVPYELDFARQKVELLGTCLSDKYEDVHNNAMCEIEFSEQGVFCERMYISEKDVKWRNEKVHVLLGPDAFAPTPLALPTTLESTLHFITVTVRYVKKQTVCTRQYFVRARNWPGLAAPEKKHVRPAWFCPFVMNEIVRDGFPTFWRVVYIHKETDRVDLFHPTLNVLVCWQHPYGLWRYKYNLSLPSIPKETEELDAFIGSLKDGK